MNSINVWNIIQYIKTKTAITNICWTNIFFGEPWRLADVNTNIYIIVNVISQIPSYATRTTRLEFRFCSKTDTIKKQELIDLQNLTTQYLSFESCNWVRDFNWFKVTSFIEWNSFVILRDNLERNILIRDYLITFIKDEFE